MPVKDLTPAQPRELSRVQATHNRVLIHAAESVMTLAKGFTGSSQKTWTGTEVAIWLERLALTFTDNAITQYE